MELIIIAGLFIVAALMLPDAQPPSDRAIESEIVRERRMRLQAYTMMRVYEMRVNGGHWEALTDRGWIKEQDLLTRAIFEEECQ